MVPSLVEFYSVEQRGKIMTVGTFVCYKAYPGDTVDRSIGVIMDINSKSGSFLVQWDDGFTSWYGAIALVKV